MKKKAFTLTELLVVVVIVGVLSAVVLPKFTKILQTRKTTEAENVMAAVRNEQEARCMVGRDYVGQEGINKLASLPKATSENYTYSLDKQGITATAKDGEYILQIPSYTDGRICCSEKVAGNGACDALNKDYPKCDATFLASLDKSTCEAPEPEPNSNEECADKDVAHPAQTLTEDGCTFTRTWTLEAYPTCWTYTDGTKTCGTQCVHPTNPDAADDCPRSGGTWNSETCECTCPPGTKDDGSASCVCDITYPANKQNKDLCDNPDYYVYEGTWNMQTCKCDCPQDTTWEEGQGCVKKPCESKPGDIQQCEDPQVVPNYAPVAGTWNYNTCECDCPPNTTKNGYGDCMPACQQTQENLYKAQDCEQPQIQVVAHDYRGNPLYDKVEGTWNWEGPHACSCDCPAGSIYRNGYCYIHCEGHDQDRNLCQQGYQSDRNNGTAVSGWYIEDACECRCPKFALAHRSGGGKVVACYLNSCTTAEPPAGGWADAKYQCEHLGDPNAWPDKYVNGRWNDEKCRCDCPRGSTPEVSHYGNSTKMYIRACKRRDGVDYDNENRTILYEWDPDDDEGYDYADDYMQDQYDMDYDMDMGWD